MRSILCGLIVATWLAAVGAVAQDKNVDQDTGKKPAKDAKANPATAAFTKLRGELEETIDRLKKIRDDYKTVRPAERPALEKEFDAKKALAKKQMAELVGTAEKAIAADGTNAQLIDFLGAMALRARGRTHEEEALRLAELVLAKQTSARRVGELHRIAADAAFNASQLDKAEKHLKALAKYPDADGGRSKRLLDKLPEERKYWEREARLRKEQDKPKEDPEALPHVLLKTTQGDIKIELFENEAPNTVANFIQLVRRKFYDGKPFSSFPDEAMVGRPDPEDDETNEDETNEDETNEDETDEDEEEPDSEKKATDKEAEKEQGKTDKEKKKKEEKKKDEAYTIPCECVNKNFRRHFRGSLSMVLAPGGKKDTGYSEFRIVYGVRPERIYDPAIDDDGKLIGGRTVFGRVIEGLEVLSKLQDPPPGEDVGKPNRIITATVVRDRGHEYKVKKVGDEKPKLKKKDDAQKKKKGVKKSKDDKSKGKKDKKNDKTKKKMS